MIRILYFHFDFFAPFEDLNLALMNGFFDCKELQSAGDKTVDPRHKLASCLEKSGMVLHGTDWCSWCTKQKEKFGPASSNVPYFDCTRKDGRRGFSDECLAKGIRVVPSWVAADGIVNPYHTINISQLLNCFIVNHADFPVRANSKPCPIHWFVFKQGM